MSCPAQLGDAADDSRTEPFAVITSAAHALIIGAGTSTNDTPRPAEPRRSRLRHRYSERLSIPRSRANSTRLSPLASHAAMIAVRSAGRAYRRFPITTKFLFSFTRAV
jgi:hypothetical protein